MALVALSALLAALVNALAAGVGAWDWIRVSESRFFWPLLRAGQVVAALFAALGGVLALTGRGPDDGLFWLYALLPLAVGLVAEQLRLLSAQTVLDQRGLPDAQAMRALDERSQQAIVLDIVRREMAVMAIAAGVVAFLLARAAGVSEGF
jgi:hypothetical protein